MPPKLVHHIDRRDLPSSVANNPKLRVAIAKDVLSYPECLLQDIKDAEACIWYLTALIACTQRLADQLKMT